jgi:putative GTP pyrophosphokinase
MLSRGSTYKHGHRPVIRSLSRCQRLGLEPTGRPAKSTTSISEKLRRESIRLTQMQDIAGCRLLVSDVANQERVVEALSHLFDDVAIVDRRERPSYGYRAVHLIVTSFGKVIEIRVRTSLQHLWAELSEKCCDVMDPAIKYSGGEETFRELLARASDAVAFVESEENQLAGILAKSPPKDQLPEDLRLEIVVNRACLCRYQQQLFELLADLIAMIENR